jgi:hypothetical protein
MKIDYSKVPAYLKGNTTGNESIHIKLMFKEVYFEHVKRRPLLIEETKPRWDMARKQWLAGARLNILDPRNRLPQGFYPVITKGEQYIIDTQLDILMAEEEVRLQLEDNHTVSISENLN